MLDLRAIREDPGPTRAALQRCGHGEALDAALALDERWRELLVEVEGGRARRNEASDAIGAAKKEGRPADEAIAAMREAAGRLKVGEDELARTEAERASVVAGLPNPPAPDAPDADTVLREEGEPRRDGPARDHLELAGAMIDMERGAELSGSRFAYLRGDLVLVELALVRFVLERLRPEGFEPVIPPVLVREKALFGTGFLPDTEQQIYALPEDGLFLAGTSEVALASLHAEDTLEAAELPLRYAGFSPCFRREAGAAGRDTRGIFRVHQFDKVEMFSFVTPEDSGDEHERLLALEEGILTALGLPYRVVAIAACDLGASAAKKYDCEAWLPSQGRYRELTSCSNTTDFQARRLNVRYRPEGGRPRHVHTLNGTAVAVGRTLIALLENGQREDGSVELPEALVAAGAPPTVGPAGA